MLLFMTLPYRTDNDDDEVTMRSVTGLLSFNFCHVCDWSMESPVFACLQDLTLKSSSRLKFGKWTVDCLAVKNKLTFIS